MELITEFVVVTIIVFILYWLFIKHVIRKSKKKVLFSIGAVLLLPMIYLIVWMNLPCSYLPPFEGKVIDADTKEPIAGAAVLAVYHDTVYTVMGPNTYDVDGQETLTDESGEFKIPASLICFGEHAGHLRGSIEIFKPEYGTLWHRRGRAVGVSTTWPPPGEYVVYELPKLKTKEERRINLPVRPSGVPYKKMKNFKRLINVERVNLGYSPLTIPEEEK